MTDVRMAVSCDPPVGATDPFLLRDCDVAQEAADALEPAVAMVAGDLSLNGPNAPGDLAVAPAQTRRLAAPVTPDDQDVRCSPAAQSAGEQTTPDRRRDHRSRVGPTLLRLGHGDRRFIGLKAVLFEGGSDAEAEQRAMVLEAPTRPGRIGVFTHAPVFAHHPDKTDAPTSAAVPRPARRRPDAVSRDGRALRRLGPPAPRHPHDHRRRSPCLGAWRGLVVQRQRPQGRRALGGLAGVPVQRRPLLRAHP